jgi:hypothetical protein
LTFVFSRFVAVADKGTETCWSHCALREGSNQLNCEANKADPVLVLWEAVADTFSAHAARGTPLAVSKAAAVAFVGIFAKLNEWHFGHELAIWKIPTISQNKLTYHCDRKGFALVVGAAVIAKEAHVLILPGHADSLSQACLEQSA